MIDTSKPERSEDTKTQSTARLMRLADLLDDFGLDAEKRYEAKKAGRPLGAVTGVRRLDLILGDALHPGIHILHGSPASGKTALALQIACSCKCPCLFVSCEMSGLELLRRITARTTDTYLGRFKSGEFNKETAMGLARRAIQTAPNLAILDATTAAARIDDFPKWIESVRQLDPDSEHLLIVVDSVHAWARGFQSTEAEYDLLNIAVDTLRRLSTQERCAILGIAERNRTSMKSGGQNASAGTRTFEYSAETVLDLEVQKEDREKEYRPVVLTVEKNRHGSTGAKVELEFEARLMKFAEL